ncbi:hypothetical protein ACM5Q9_13550 [Advenella sp. RU8]|uniref:hypothetical protein n=1 Tax=Advenella sp. RU8 TaxID=3399575 RepID=UPI003AAABCE6
MIGLFHRSGRGVTLTERGQQLMVYAQTISSTLETAMRAMQKNTATGPARLRIGALSYDPLLHEGIWLMAETVAARHGFHLKLALECASDEMPPQPYSFAVYGIRTIPPMHCIHSSFAPQASGSPCHQRLAFRYHWTNGFWVVN